MDTSILLSIFAFCFSCISLSVAVGGQAFLYYRFQAELRRIEDETNEKLRLQAEYLQEQAKNDAFEIVQDSIQSRMDQTSDLSIANFSNFGV